MQYCYALYNYTIPRKRNNRTVTILHVCQGNPFAVNSLYLNLNAVNEESPPPSHSLSELNTVTLILLSKSNLCNWHYGFKAHAYHFLERGLTVSTKCAENHYDRIIFLVLLRWNRP